MREGEGRVWGRRGEGEGREGEGREGEGREGEEREWVVSCKSFEKYCFLLISCRLELEEIKTFYLVLNKYTSLHHTIFLHGCHCQIVFRYHSLLVTNSHKSQCSCNLIGNVLHLFFILRTFSAGHIFSDDIYDVIIRVGNHLKVQSITVIFGTIFFKIGGRFDTGCW